MSRLGELIRTLCPNGVEYKRLGEICKIMNGKDYKHLEKGDIPVYGSGGIMAYVDTFAYDLPSVLLPRKGSIGNVFYIDKPFWTVDTIYWTKINADIIIPKFLYYYIQTQNIEKLNTATGSIPSLTQAVLNDINVPVPPMEVQEEIVRILDKFTALEAELEARKKQYEHYRDTLLDFTPPVDENKALIFKRLGDVCDMIRGVRVTKRDLIPNGKYPVVSGGTGYMGYINDYNREATTITIAQYGTAGYVKWQEQKFWANDVCFSVLPNEEIVVNRYLYYVLSNKQEYLYSISNREAVPYSKRY